MAEAQTHVFRVSLSPKIYRDFEILSAKNLYDLAGEIAGLLGRFGMACLPVPRQSATLSTGDKQELVFMADAGPERSPHRFQIADCEARCFVLADRRAKVNPW